MALSSSSTFTEIQAAYMNNLPPFRSATQCQAFIEACAALILKMPEQSGAPEAQIRFRIDLIHKERADAQVWLDANGGSSASGGDSGTTSSGSPRSTRFSFRNFRE